MLRRFLSTTVTMLRQPNFAGLLASTFALGTAFSFVAPFLSKWGTEEVGMSPRGFSVFMTLTSVAAMVVGTVLGRLSDTSIPRRAMLAIGSLGGALGFAGYALIRDPIALVAVGCTLQALASTCFAQLFSHVREAFHQTGPTAGHSSMTMSVVRVCFSFSWTVGPALGALTLVHLGFRGLFLSAAGLYAVFLLGTLRYVPKQQRPSSGIERPAHPSIWKTLRRADLRLCFLAFAGVAAANAINMLTLPLAFTRSFGGSNEALGIVFGIGPVVEIPLMLWFGHLASKGGQLALIRFGVAITLAYYVGLSFANAPWHIYALQILNGAAFSILTNVAILFFQDLMPRQTGLATSLFSSSQASGNLVGVLSFGFLIESLGYRHSYVVCAALAACALALIFRLRPANT